MCNMYKGKVSHISHFNGAIMQISKKGNRKKRLSFYFWWGEMRETELCMKYDTCRRCPLNKKCTAECKKQDKKKRKDREEIRKMKRGYYE